MQKDHSLTQETIISQGHQRLSKQELETLTINKTVWGDYYYNNEWFLYVSYINQDGTMQGENDLESYNEGRWKINQDGSYTVEWDGYWEDWTAFVYSVDGELMFFDTTTEKWRTTFTKLVEGDVGLVV
jgi:hypothetical protein